MKTFLHRIKRKLNASKATILALLSLAFLFVNINKSFSQYTYSTLSSATMLIATGTDAVTGDDVISGAIAIPFTFSFYGTGYSSVYVCTNGYISFSSTTETFTNYAIPTSSLVNDIAFCQTDLNSTSGTAGTAYSIYYATTGSAPNRVFVIHFQQVIEYGQTNYISGEIQLYETSNIIELAVSTLTAFTSHCRTLGINLGDGSTGMAVPGWSANCTYANTISNMTYIFTPLPACTTPGQPTAITGTATGPTTANLSWVAGTPAGSPTVTYSWFIGTNPAGTCSSGGGPGSASFSYTGGLQTWTVPAGVTSITVDAAGAQGGGGYPVMSRGGYGGRVQATYTVTPGTVLDIYVGGAGGNGASTVAGTGGYNGGAAGALYSGSYSGGGGGGASDIRVTPYALANRIVVAGGGGGGGYNYAIANYEKGGAGGETTGEAGYSDNVLGVSGGMAGGGGTPSVGGFGGTYSSCNGSAGTSGVGGIGGACSNSGGGGGGGWYGGGGGSWTGGGGGSSYTTGATSVTHTQGYNSTGNGYVSITYTAATAIDYGTTIGTSATTSALTCGTTYYLSVYATTSCNSTSSTCGTSGAFTPSCCIAPSITAQPTNQTMCVSSSATFNVVASGTATLSYQWKYNGSNVTNGTPAGAVYTNSTTSAMTVSGVTTSPPLSYTCYISNACGNVTTSPVTLTINALATPGTFQYANGSMQSICSGSTISCSNSTSPTAGSGTLQVCWYCGQLTAGSPGAGGTYGNWVASVIAAISGAPLSANLVTAVGGVSGVGNSLTNYNPLSDFSTGDLTDFVIYRRAYNSNCNPCVGACEDQLFYLTLNAPTVATACPNQYICSSVITTATMAASGTGTWSFIRGPGGSVITTPASATTTITGLSPGTFVFRWTTCGGYSEVVINVQ